MEEFSPCFKKTNQEEKGKQLGAKKNENELFE
jgi:hypothetical protein